MEELNEYSLKTIKIPKVTGTTVLYINKSDVYTTRKGFTVTLKRQTVAGIVIPHGTLLDVEYFDEGTNTVSLLKEEMNALLKMLYLDSLRTIKHDNTVKKTK